MLVLINTDAPVAARKANERGAVSRRLLWIKNFEKWSLRDWAMEAMVGSTQILVAVGKAAALWIELANRRPQSQAHAQLVPIHNDALADDGKDPERWDGQS